MGPASTRSPAPSSSPACGSVALLARARLLLYHDQEAGCPPELLRARDPQVRRTADPAPIVTRRLEVLEVLARHDAVAAVRERQRDLPRLAAVDRRELGRVELPGGRKRLAGAPQDE